VSRQELTGVLKPIFLAKTKLILLASGVNPIPIKLGMKPIKPEGIPKEGI